MKNKLNIFRKTVLLLASIIVTSSFVSCVGSDTFRDELADTGSKEDTVFPAANFDYTADQENFKFINFTDLSTEAASYAWDFGSGATSTERDPSNEFAGEGTYPVTLIASDGNGVSSTVTLDVVVVDELVAAFQCQDFLCDPRTPWAGVDRGTTSSYSASSSPTPPDDNGAAKLSSSSNFLDQSIRVVSGATYEVTFWYVSKSSGTSAGALLIEDTDTGDDILSQAIPLSASASSYEEISFRFTVGDETENIRFNIEYAGTEVRFSKISIDRI
ncbi:PKD domain-containing protein [Cellulophaga sp. E16_2]|uniref:PKD domain containing protein n=1 Tax=Cellulophaga algicola (strain DSM 14237 / IC166 / ACAM 630) TaxID=688270 RepID=E6XFI6_CELAD|nr:MULTISPECIES: PKD domain-containing protein [Cellulophaga]ADV51459.1 PKD domain containing protein [Cellulophaga algicola DSM 14237]MBO0593832.1 PKD domain-containing protein [Cellulophaga sp. E16_2]